MRNKQHIILSLVAAAGILTAWGHSTPVLAQSNVVYINSSGGQLDAVNRKVMWDPFTKATGIKVISSAPVNNAKLKAMVLSGNVEWDVTEIDDGDFVRAIKQHLLAKLDLKRIPIAELPKDAYNDYGIWDGPYSTILTWNTKLWPMTGKHPTSLMDLWNQKDFPGPRCLWKDAMDNLELGVLHANVPRQSVYPINEKLAYKELDKLAKHVGVWWTTGAQSVQAIVNGDCVMGTAWNGRPYELVVKDKASLGVAWKDAILRTSWWAIPKGAKHYDNAIKLIAWMQNAKRQAEQATLSGYSGGNKGTAALLSKTVRTYLATSPKHLKESVVASDKWWEINGPAAENRFTSWVITK